MKKEILKIAVTFFIIVGVVVWGLNFIFFGQAPKSKATGETMNLSFIPATATVAANADFTVTILAEPSINTVLRGYKTKVNFDKAILKFKSIQYKVGVVSVGLGNTTADATAVNGNGFVDVIGEDKTATGYSLEAAKGDGGVASITFTALATTATTVRMTDSSFYSINSNGTLFDTWTIAPTNLDVNGGETIGNVKLNLKLKFQGITKKPPTEALNFIKGKIEGKIIGTNEGFASGPEGNLLVKSDDNGVWSGTVGIDLPKSSLGKKFTLFIKGRRHIQKKICDSAPTETSPGTYRCSTGNITLIAGDNNLNFSGILLLSGDIYGPEKIQDGLVNSIDISFIRNNLNKTDAATLTVCDINLDGKCDTQDYSLVINALLIKTDEQ